MVGFFRGLLVLVFLIAIGIAAYIAFAGDPEIPPELLAAKYANDASQYAELASGARMHYRDQGKPDGLPLVLLHGSNASLHTWEPWVKELGDTFRVITIDLPGHGLTGAVPGDDYSQEGMAKFVAEAATALKLHRFALGGNSMGGGVAARFALLYPDRLTHLILVDAGGMPTKVETDPGLGFRLARIPGVRNIMLYVSPRALFEEGLKKAIIEDALVTPDMVDRYWELNRRAGSRAATLKRFQTPHDTFVQNNADKITTPTLILWGADDTLTPRDVGEAYAQSIPGSKLVVYNGIGHIPMEETPDQSARAVREFLAPSPPPPEPEVLPASSPTPP
jgi:pimeloyl-ACP methyl ester carboxylesterase